MHHRSSFRVVFLLTFLTVSLAVALPLSRGQSLTADNFVRGQFAQLEVTNAQPGATVAWLLSLAGTGAGPCYPSIATCLGLLDPVAVVATDLADTSGCATLSPYIPPTVPLLTLHFQAAAISFAGGVSVQMSNAVSLTIDDLGAFDDTFDGSTLDAGWQVHNPAAAQVTVANGRLEIEPIQSGPNATWFEDGEGVMVYKAVSGDFSVVATVRSSDPSNELLPPPAGFRLGGLIVRDPNSVAGDRNSSHVALGSGGGAATIGVEQKETIGSDSTFTIAPTAETAGQVRITRNGSLIGLDYRSSATAVWQSLAVHDHPEFPFTVQVGMMAYSFSSPPAIVTRFDEIRFENL